MPDPHFFLLAAPILAIDDGVAWVTVRTCAACGAIHHERRGPLSVTLEAPGRAVWLGDGGAVLVRPEIAKMLDTDSMPARTRWRDDASRRDQPVPALVTLEPRDSVEVDDSRIERRPCGCIAGIAMPWVLQPLSARARVLHVSQNARFKVFSDEARALMLAQQPDLEFKRIRFTGEPEPERPMPVEF